MDTSDSECFESADEDISEECPSRTFFSKNSSNINLSNLNEDLVPNSKTVSDNDYVEESIVKDNINFLRNNNSVLLPNKVDTSDTFNLLNQKEENNKCTNFCSNAVSTWETEQLNEVNDGTVKGIVKELSEGDETDVNIQKGAITKNDCDNLNKKELLKDNADIWEDDWSKESEAEIEIQKSLSTKNIDQGHLVNEELLEGNKDIWEDDWGQWESVSNEKLENLPNKTMESPSNVLRSETENSGTWGDWGNWGVTSLLSTATSSVSTITNQVTQGITNVLESGIGVPDPEELAKISKEREKRNINENFNNNIAPATTDNLGHVKNFNFESLLTSVTQITKLVETTSTKVISGGLDTLETIGKKTMEVLQEGDPGLKKKRAFLRIDSEKPNLSQVLREAKEKSQEENKEKKPNTKKVNYETLFDDHHGLVHLEALEMLSKQCNIKLSSLIDSSSNEDLTELHETIDQIRELCELPEDDDEQLNVEEIIQKLEECIFELGILISYDKLISVWKDTEIWLKNISSINNNEIHEKAINTLAQVTAFAVEQFHKCAELLLTKQHRSTADEADSLVQITVTLTSFVGYIASEFCKVITENEMQTTDTKDLITNIYFEAANSSIYIKDAFKLLIPVIEVGAM